MDEKEIVALRIELPKQIYDSIRNDGNITFSESD